MVFTSSPEKERISTPINIKLTRELSINFSTNLTSYANKIETINAVILCSDTILTQSCKTSMELKKNKSSYIEDESLAREVWKNYSTLKLFMQERNWPPIMGDAICRVLRLELESTRVCPHFLFFSRIDGSGIESKRNRKFFFYSF